MSNLIIKTPIGGLNKAQFSVITGSSIAITVGMELNRIISSSPDKDPRAGAFVMDFESEQMNEAFDTWLETRLTTIATEQQTSTYEDGLTASYSPSSLAVTNDIMLYAYPIVPGETKHRCLIARTSVTGPTGTISTSANTAGSAPVQVTSVATSVALTIPDDVWENYGLVAPVVSVILPIGSTGKIVYVTPTP